MAVTNEQIFKRMIDMEIKLEARSIAIQEMLDLLHDQLIDVKRALFGMALGQHDDFEEIEWQGAFDDI